MIVAKATRETSVSPTASHDRYAAKEEPRSRLPVAFGLFLVGITAYLRSSLSSAAAAPVEDQPRAEKPEEAAAPAEAGPAAVYLAAISGAAEAPFMLIDSPAVCLF